jgi:pSer/pThr/pTyr-binding forkhead associated (FHA) protein
MTSGAEAWLVDERWFKAYPLIEETTIGRGSACSIILRDPAVSRVHAAVRRTAKGYTVEPRGSAGTKLNGNALTTATVLSDGDVIDIAFTSLRFTTQAPTGEMFVVSRDYPTSVDRLEPPTRDTLHAMHPITLMSRSRLYWRRILVAVLIVAMLAFLLASMAG